MGQSPAGLFGYSHMTGGFPAARPNTCACPTPTSVRSRSPSDLPDEKVVFLSDIFPTGYMAAEKAQIQPGDTVAIWGCGPVAQFTIRSAWMLGAGRVIAIDRVPERLRWPGAGQGRDDRLREAGRLRHPDGDDQGTGPDRCIDAVGAEAHAGGSFDAVLDKAKAAVGLATDRPHVLREAIMCCRKGGHGVDPRRLHRLPGQDSLRRR